MSKKINIIKVGGGVMENSKEMKDFLKRFSSIEGYKILVHGGGRGANEMLNKMGITPKMHQGRRITDNETLDIVVQLYAGLFNKKIVSYLNSIGTKSIGLSGADGELIPSNIRPKTPIDYGWVGDPIEEKVNSKLLTLLLSNGYTPICCAISYSQEGNLLNTNADTIAAVLSVAMSKAGFEVELTYCFEKEGVLLDINNPLSLVERIDQIQFEQMKKDGMVSEGMIPKLSNAFKTIENGVKQVRLCKTENLVNQVGTVVVSWPK